MQLAEQSFQTWFDYYHRQAIVLFVLITKKRVSKRGREWSILRKFNLPTSVTRCGIKSIPEITQREATTVLNEKSVF